jgi:hypothetical protein
MDNMNGNTPAQPCMYKTIDKGQLVDMIATGLTKREYFAAIALQGILSAPEKWVGNRTDAAVDMADSLLKSLEKLVYPEKPEMGDNKSMTESEFNIKYMCAFGRDEGITFRDAKCI